MNTNRLRAYNSSIEDWQKLKKKYEKVSNADNNAELQTAQDRSASAPTAASGAASAPPDYAEFDKTNEIVILNPSVTPIPNTNMPAHIKRELEDSIEQVQEETSEHEDISEQEEIAPDTQPEAIEKVQDESSGSDPPFLKVLGKTFTKMASRPKPKVKPAIKLPPQTKSVKRPAKEKLTLPAKKLVRDISDTPLPTRRSARTRGVEGPEFEESDQQLQAAEKQKKK